MSGKRFNVTYEIVTPESAEHGDAAERGFIGVAGLQFSIDGICGQPAAELKAECGMSLREAFDRMCAVEDCGHWFAEVDGRPNYQTGADTRYSFHPPETITAASYGRLRRLFGLESRS